GPLSARKKTPRQRHPQIPFVWCYLVFSDVVCTGHRCEKGPPVRTLCMDKKMPVRRRAKTFIMQELSRITCIELSVSE
ncbi:hypothetical protein, partial [Escherichia coli]|uniref:hypothetical protein n=1 Tax=Escherichia coli TaxID=562 RepID=UPI002FE608C5